MKLDIKDWQFKLLLGLNVITLVFLGFGSSGDIADYFKETAKETIEVVVPNLNVQDTLEVKVDTLEVVKPSK